MNCRGRRALEFVAQRELHFARRRHMLKVAEGQRRRERQTRIGEVHIVKRIESFGAELDALAFLGQPESLLQRQVGIEKRREAHGRPRPRVPR